MPKSRNSGEKTVDVVRQIRPRWDSAIFVCGKCLKRHPDGKGLRRTLKTAAKERPAMEASGRKTRIVKTACLGLCPKDAVIVASAATLSADNVLLVRDVDGMANAVPHLLNGRRVRPHPSSPSRNDAARTIT